jgi:hypothetical protein
MPLAFLNRALPGVRVAVKAFRNRLEADVLANGGGGVATASRLHTACLAFQRCLEAERRLAEGRETMKPDEWMTLAAASLRWKETCDRALKDLGLKSSREPMNWADRLDEIRRQEAAFGSAPGATPPDATGANLDGVSGNPADKPVTADEGRCEVELKRTMVRTAEARSRSEEEAAQRPPPGLPESGFE